MASSTRRERLRASQVADQKRRKVRILAAVGVGVGALVAIAVMIWSSIGGGAGAAGRPPSATATGDGIVVNPGTARPGVPVVGVYLDYQCSHCVQFEEKYGFTLNELANAGDIQLVNHTKVFLDRGNAAGLSHRTAIAAACSDEAGVYKNFHQSIFSAAYNGQYTDELLRSTLPQQTGITGDALTRFQSCYDTRRMAGFVQGVEEAASRAGFTATPALVVNGKTQDLTALPDDVNKLAAFIDTAARG